MIHEVMFPLSREAVAEMINDDAAVAELMGWSTPEDLRDGLPDLIYDLAERRPSARGGDLVFAVRMSHDDFNQIKELASGVDVAISERVHASLMRSVIAFLDEVDDAEADWTES